MGESILLLSMYDLMACTGTVVPAADRTVAFVSKIKFIKCFAKKYCTRAWTGVISLRILPSGELL